MKAKRVHRASNAAYKAIEVSLHESISTRTALLLERNKARQEETNNFLAQLRNKANVNPIATVQPIIVNPHGEV